VIITIKYVYLNIDGSELMDWIKNGSNISGIHQITFPVNLWGMQQKARSKIKPSSV
jgi:hypothetical protein